MKSRAENISKQLHGWIESLKNSDIKGVKFFTQKERDRIGKNREFEEFDREMEEFRRRHLEMLQQREADTASIRQEAGEYIFD